MSDRLLDSGILIRYLRQSSGYRELLHSMALDGELYISAFTRLEIVRGMRDYEQEITFELLDSMITLPMDYDIADTAGELIRAWRSKGITLGDADATIVATALRYDFDLVTTNARHFPMPELVVWQVDNDGQMARWQRT